MATLAPVLKELGYRTEAEQKAFAKLLHATGAYGNVPGVSGVLSDAQAEAVLNNVHFESLSQAADWLHEVTQEKMLRRPAGAERWESQSDPKLDAQRAQIVPLLDELGLLDAEKPRSTHYDHVLLLGATQPTVDERLEMLRQVWDQGVRFDRISLLGSERPLNPEREPLAAELADKTEMAMMEKRFIDSSAGWPQDLQSVPVTAVDTLMKKDGSRPTTRDTAQAWVHNGAKPGRVLVISNQPYLEYQHEAVMSALPPGFQVDTIGSAAKPDYLRLNVATDALARRIDVGFTRLKDRLKHREKESEILTGLVMMKPADIGSDPKTYQFRSEIEGEGGVTKGYRTQVKEWDPILNNDPLLVHQRKDGSYFVADGHHRLDLAKRMNAEGKGPAQVYAQVLREEDGYSAADVRVIAAYKNLAHGHTDLIDAAKVMKEARDPAIHRDKLPKLPMDRGNLRQAEQLSHLSGEAFSFIERGEVPPEVGAEVAKRVKDPIRQIAVMDIVREKLKDQPMEQPEQIPHAAAVKQGHLQATVAPIARIREGELTMGEGKTLRFKETMMEQKPSVAFTARIEQEKLQKAQSNQLSI